MPKGQTQHETRKLGGRTKEKYKTPAVFIKRMRITTMKHLPKKQVCRIMTNDDGVDVLKYHSAKDGMENSNCAIAAKEE